MHLAMLNALKTFFSRTAKALLTGWAEDQPMTTILHIDSSILGSYSVSRSLTADIVAKQQVLH